MTSPTPPAEHSKDVTIIGLRLPVELQRRTRELAQRDGRSMSNFIRRLLVKAVQEGEANNGPTTPADNVQHF